MLSVIIPCYNEETLVEKSFIEIIKALKDSKIAKYEIIFFDDNSQDNSLEVVNKYKLGGGFNGWTPAFMTSNGASFVVSSDEEIDEEDLLD